MLEEYINSVVTRELVNDVFGSIVSKHGGWNPLLMPLYINTVCDRISDIKYDQVELRKEVIRKMKEFDPILFKKV